MRVKIRFLLVVLSILFGTLVAIALAPFAVSRGLRLWLSWKTAQQNLTLSIDKVDAPFLRPVVIHGLHITSTPKNPFHIDLRATQATIDLNLRAIVLRLRGRAIRTLTVEGLRTEARRDHPGPLMSQPGWSALQKVFPSSFNFNRFDLRLEDGPTVVLLHNLFLSASEVEAGRFNAGEITIASPWVRQSFAQLRGATNWQGNRLTVAGLSLARGLDLQWMTIDFAQLAKERVELDFDIDAFGGKIRGNISDQWTGPRSVWDLVGSGTDISLAQTFDALGFTDRVDGLLHAAKFTFRGDPGDPMHAVASLWTELTALNWRNRAAEVIMFGASLYNRQIDIQQLYVKQSENQLTLNGLAALPANSSDWLSPDFRGNISASINQLGDFAALFGANPADFAGKISIEGTMDARDKKFGGSLQMAGASLTLFKTGIDSFNTKLNLKANELEIEQFKLTRKNDSLSGQGKIDMAHRHNYSGSINATVDNLVDYWSVFRGPTGNNSKPTPANIQATIDSGRWNASGAIVLPGSSPLNFTADFLLPIGTDRSALPISPLNLTLDFPSIFLASAAQFFHPEIFRDGILSGKLQVSQSLQHPQIIGDMQLINGKLQVASLNLNQASGRITFGGDHGSIDFFNAATNDVDLAFHGDIDLRDTGNLTLNLVTTMPFFDLTARPIDCVSKIEIAPVTATLAPAIAQFEIHGGLFGSAWTVNLRNQASVLVPADLSLTETARKFPLCLGKSEDDSTLVLGAFPRPEIRPEPVRTKRPKKRR